jgi:tetratricopeptide (TPR) repeat protein
MSRNKKQNKEISITADKNISYRFIFTSGNCHLENLKVLDESVKRLKKELQDQCSFLVLDSAEGQVGKLVEIYPEAHGLQLSPNIRIITDAAEITTGSSPSSQYNHCIWLSLDSLVRPINFNEFFRSEIPVPADNEYYLINWEDEKTSVFAGFNLHQQTSDFLLSQPSFSKNPDLVKTNWYLRQNRLIQKFQTLNHPSPFKLKTFKSNFKINPVSVLKQWIDWNIISAFRNRLSSDFSFNCSNPAINRLLFFIVALLALVILPLISYDAGISGDEEKHYMQAGKVYNYFASDGKDTSALSDEKYKLNYYGQSFDLFTYVIIKKLHIEKIYEARHVMNGFLGASAILCSGLLARLLMGNIAGIFTMFLLFFSPGYLGHAMNNPLDVPFAFGYIFTLLQLVRFLKRLPVINYRIAILMALGIAFTISIRIGGLLLIPYIFMFSGLYVLFTPMPWKNFSSRWIKLAAKGLLVLAGISILAYFLSILPWPYARQNPLKNPFEAMKMMANISVALRVMFEGKIFWSDNLPASYIPKNILLTVPLMVMAGFIAGILFIRKNRNIFWIFFLFFIVVFPVVYIIYKESNVYGAWRHLLFIYPPMVVMAGLGIQSILDISKNKYFRYGILLVFTGAMVKPVAHIVRNYPNQYIYFNEIAGGVKKAYKKYETDYYMVSLKPGTDWIKENILKKISADSAQPVRIISNAPADIMNYYFRGYKDKVKLPYTRYYDRGLYDWDYAIFFCNYIDPYQITHNIWPPKNTIYTVNLDGVKICAVVKRVNKDDFRGYELLNKAMKTRNNFELDESIRLMENAIKLDNQNEITYLNVAQAYIQKNEFETARKKLNELLGIYPNYEKALNMIGFSYLNEGEIKNDKMKIERSITILNEVLRINYKFAGAYHNLGLAYLILGDDETAFRYFQKAIDNNPSLRESYYMMATIFEKRGDPKKAREIREYASRL